MQTVRGGCTLGADERDRGVDAERGTRAFEVLAWCVDDFTSLATVFDLASKGIDDFGAQRAAALAVLRVLVRGGLVRVGEMSSGSSGLACWQVDSEASAERLSQVLMDLATAPTPEMNIWLHATVAGRRHFEAQR